MRALAAQTETPAAAIVKRLRALAPLDAVDVATIDRAVEQARFVRVRRDLATEGRSAPPPTLVVSGWAARVRIFPDGQRQFLSFLMPGDLIGLCRQPQPVAVSTVISLTDMLVCDAPMPRDAPAIHNAYAVSNALEEAHLLSHISRLGRMTAAQRIADLFLEFHERLTLNGMAAGGQFDLPLTQEMLGDALGLTSVHVNRMIQQMRARGEVAWKGGRVTIHDPASLASTLGRGTIRVTSQR